MLRRLTLIVTHNCNLKCTYCYAKGGDFGLRAGTMTEALAVNIFEHFVRHFGHVGEVFFFGGEPLIALKVIRTLCNHISQMLSSGSINEMPQFAIVTNGTLISNEFIELAKQYNLEITVSVDGPQPIHDLHRHSVSGQGTAEVVLAGIERLRTAGLRFGLECTYTLAHWMNGYSPIDVHKYLESLGAKTVSLTEILMPYPEKGLFAPEVFDDYFSASIDLFCNAIRECDLGGRAIHVGLAKILEALIKYPEYLDDHFCSAGISTFAINPTGQTYPCHMLNNQLDFCLGHYQKVNHPVDILPKKSDFDECTKCVTKRFCRACPARMYLTSDSGMKRPCPEACRMLMAFASLTCYSLLKGDFGNILSEVEI